MRCLACRKPLTNEASKKYGYGPVCLRRAVKNGTAPLEALTELAECQRSKKRDPKPAKQTHDALTIDLFSQPRREAIDRLIEAADQARSFGVRVNIVIEE